MKLKSIEIYGFKSFADRTLLEFNQGITGIVGPNGSGKSNISDAVRWVLGEQSPKALRGSRMEDVIFSGTENRKALPYCEVSLLFDNEDGSLNTDFSEVMVTRRAYRSGEGEYYLNKNLCRLRDILELFRDTGIGKEGYSIIGQGRIDDILSVKSNERRQVFEEAAGIVTYRVRKEEAERNLQKTRENLVRVNDIIDEISLRLEPLQKQAEDAKTYLSNAERLKLLDLNIFIIRQDRLKTRLKSIEERIKTYSEALSSAQENIKLLTEKRIQLDEKQESLDEKDKQQRRAQLQLSEEIQETTNERERLQAALNSHIKESERLKNEAIQLEEKLADILSGTKDTSERQKEKQSQLDSLQEKLNKEQLELAIREEKENEKQLELDNHRDELLNIANRVTDAKTLETRQHTILSQLEEQLSRLEQVLVQKADSLKKGETVLSEIAENTSNVAEQIENAKKDVEKLLSKRETAEEVLEKAIEYEHKMVQDIGALRSKLTLLEEMAEGYEGYYNAVKQAIKISRNNPNVHGVVAKLIEVPKEYETAIDMLLGGQLQHIVTKDEETAQEIIDYLRKNRLGRTTFLPLTSVKGRTLSESERKLLSTEGCLGLASELIHYDDKYKGIVDSLLGRCIITKDLKSAIDIMRKGSYRFNAVTLNGDVMRAGGSMTGGTSQNQSASLLGRERQRKELAKSIKQLEEALSLKQSEIAKLKEEYDEISLSYANADKKLNEINLQYALEKEKLQSTKVYVEKERLSLDETKQAQAQLELAIDDINKDLADIKTKSEAEQVDQGAMQQKTKDLQEMLKSAREDVATQREIVQELVLNEQSVRHELLALQKEEKLSLSEQESLSKRASENYKISDEEYNKAGLIKESLVVLNEKLQGLQNKNIEQQRESDKLEIDRQQLFKARKRNSDETELLHNRINEENDKLHKAELLYARNEDERNSLASNILSKYDMTYAQALDYRFEDNIPLPSLEREANEKREIIKHLGHINVHAVEEYAATKERYDDMSTQKEDAEKAEQDLTKLIDRLLKEMSVRFVGEFKKLGEHFQESFTRLFGGGTAALTLSDPENPLTCDIEISAQPPGKRLQLMSLLSGGERALTAIAILFAMLKLKPTPFCVLDEIEAALDDANIGHFADYLSEFAKTTQFIVVTHRKGTMECCDSLYGVAMQEKGVSTMVSVNLEDYKN
ncbi:MAG: chromosome segregation protein SMC [Christensenellaceae bacterium]|nr:chromosome segregation protein SMC [Christensenellaceae bacterium]